MNQPIGRQVEISRISAFLDQSRTQRVARMVRLVGPSGIGKTTIAEAVVRDAAEQGWRSASTVSHRIQATLPFIVARKTLNALVNSLGADATTYISGLEREIELASERSSDPQIIESVLVRLLEAVLIDSPLLLVFDDAHWTDPESRTLFTRLLQALGDQPIALLSVERSEESPAAGAFGFSDETIVVKELDPAASTMLARMLLPGAPEEVVQTIAEHARGRAVDIVAVARSTPDPKQLTRAEVRATLRALIAQSLSLLSSETREFLQLCSLLSEPIEYELLKQLWPDDSRLLALIHECSDRYLTQEGDAIQFVHAAVSQSVRETIAIEIPYRKRIIDALCRLPAPRLEDYERLVEQAAACGDRELERNYLRKVAEEASRTNVLPVVARTLDRIIALTPFDPNESLALYAQLSQLYLALSRESDAIRVSGSGLDFAVASGVRENLGPLVAAQIFAHTHRGDREQALQVARTFDGHLTDKEDRAYLLTATLWTDINSSYESDFSETTAKLDALGVEKPQLVIRKQVFEAWHMARRGNTSQALKQLEWARSKALEGLPVLLTMTDTVATYISSKSLGLTHPTVDAKLAALQSSNDVRTYTMALRLLASGNALDAINYVAEALIHFEGVAARRTLLGIAAIASALSDIPLSSAMRRAVREEAEYLIRSSALADCVTIAMAHAAISMRDGSPLDRASIRKIYEASLLPSSPVSYLFPITLVQVAASQNDRNLLALMARDDWEPHERLKWNIAQYKLARMTASKMLGRDVPKGTANELAAEFQSLGSVFFAEFSERLIAENPPAKPSSSQQPKLTKRETEVASLVAQGFTNRDIAERLVLSERTVEAHVANIFAKIDASSRAQVAAWYARLTTAQP